MKKRTEFISLEEASRRSKKKHPESTDILGPRVAALASGLETNKNILYAVVIAFFIAFIFLSIDAWKYHAESYHQFTDKLNSLEEKNYDLKVSILQDKIDNLDHEIQELKAVKNNSVTKNPPPPGS